MDQETKYDSVDAELDAVLEQSMAAVNGAGNGRVPSHLYSPGLQNAEPAPAPADAQESVHDPPQRPAPQPRHEVDPPTIPQSDLPRESAAAPKREAREDLKKRVVVPYPGSTYRSDGHNGDRPLHVARAG